MNDEQKLRRSELVGTVTVDETGAFTEVNDDACELFGYARAELIGTQAPIIMPHRFRAGHRAGFEHYVKTRQSIGLIDKLLEVYGLHKTGYEFPMTVRVTVKNVNGKLIFGNTFRDITLKRELERGRRFQEPPVFSDLYTLLIVEADFDAQEALISELRHYRITNRIVVVTSVEEAEDFALFRGAYADRPKLPYIVLLSMLLPQSSGLELLRSLRGNESTKRVPCIITTVLPRTPEMDELIALGSTAYMQKPILFTELTSQLGALDMNWMICKRTN